MKKKHRTIVIDNQPYGWIAGNGWVSIYKNKKLIHEEHKIKESSITPIMIEKIIRDNKL